LKLKLEDLQLDLDLSVLTRVLTWDFNAKTRDLLVTWSHLWSEHCRLQVVQVDRRENETKDGWQ